MVALNFMKEFAEAVKNGEKRQTIRDKTQAFVGCDLQLYTGMRHKNCRKLLDAKCNTITRMTLMEKVAQPHGNVLLMGEHLEQFARNDGFKTYADMWAFFKDRADANGEYKGYLIKW